MAQAPLNLRADRGRIADAGKECSHCGNIKGMGEMQWAIQQPPTSDPDDPMTYWLCRECSLTPRVVQRFISGAELQLRQHGAFRFWDVSVQPPVPVNMPH